MQNSDPKLWSWDIGVDAYEIHSLLCDSDAYSAILKAPAPIRNIKTTHKKIADKCVHILRYGHEAIAMFTLTKMISKDRINPAFSQWIRPVYISRLAVKSEWQKKGDLAGVQCIRKAVELAKAHGADAILSEVNPNIEKVKILLNLFGFEECTKIQTKDEQNHIYLQKSLI